MCKCYVTYYTVYRNSVKGKVRLQLHHLFQEPPKGLLHAKNYVQQPLIPSKTKGPSTDFQQNAEPASMLGHSFSSIR